MQRNNIIVIVSPVVETWGNLKKLCDHYGLNYNTMCRKTFPINYKGFEIHKTPLN
jgi:hypothetical protein